MIDLKELEEHLKDLPSQSVPERSRSVPIPYTLVFTSRSRAAAPKKPKTLPGLGFSGGNHLDRGQSHRGRARRGWANRGADRTVGVLRQAVACACGGGECGERRRASINQRTRFFFRKQFLRKKVFSPNSSLLGFYLRKKRAGHTHWPRP